MFGLCRGQRRKRRLLLGALFWLLAAVPHTGESERNRLATSAQNGHSGHVTLEPEADRESKRGRVKC